MPCKRVRVSWAGRGFLISPSRFTTKLLFAEEGVPGNPLQDAVERVVREQIALVEIGAEGGVIGVAAELLQLAGVDAAVPGGVSRRA
jgi:hypothetical protein